MSGAVSLVDADEAVAGIEDGMTVMLGGWGLCGSPDELVAALARAGRRNLTVIMAGSAQSDPLHAAGAVTRMITSFGSYAGTANTDRPFERRAQAGELTVELCSQGVLAERIRAGGAGIPAFYVAAAAVGRFRSTDETRTFDGVPCVLETALRADVALVQATVADLAGNLSWRDGERNYNEVMCWAADRVLVEAVELCEVGEMAPEQVMVPGLAVDVLTVAPADA
ncbi:MAG: CoA transferase subunit A [Acidimicrobiales bacterium]